MAELTPGITSTVMPALTHSSTSFAAAAEDETVSAL